MVNKLKKNFILTNMMVMLISLTTIFLYIYLSSAHSMKEESFKTLEISKVRISVSRGIGSNKGFSILKVEVDENNNIIGTAGDVFLEDNAITELIESVEDEKGTLLEYHVRYLVDEVNEHKEYYLIDISFEREVLLSLMFRLIGIEVIALIVFFFISIQLSKMIIKPAEIAWDNQKQFIGNASHELKTPLTIILANSELLEESDLGSKSNYTRVGYVKQEANRMKSLVEELLFLAKFDEFADELIMEQHNISDIIMESILMFDPIAYEHKIGLQSEIVDDIYMECIPNQIKQLSDIFVDNAVKYTPAGEKIVVKLYKEKNQIIYSINNSGTFMDDSELEQIFNRFYQKDKARGKHKDSYGLGLAIAQKICQVHNGLITVDSTPEKGTTFTVKFTHKIF
ncbi:MAG: HAMP domain-containing histidine kinase [Clostridiales bacterium]|nr:HAMP domain-containing histidine kinase [Clostridiales bacterium]